MVDLTQNLLVAAEAMLHAMGGNPPDWLKDEHANLEAAIATFNADREKSDSEKLADALKAFAETGAILDQLGGKCPVQAEGSIDRKRFYFRARGERWQWTVAENDDEIFTKSLFHIERPYGDEPFDAGWMSEEEAVGFMLEGVRIYRADRDLREAYTGQGGNEGTPFAEWVKAMADDNAGTLQSAACLWLLNKGGVTE